jgi:hypothetical protein
MPIPYPSESNILNTIFHHMVNGPFFIYSLLSIWMNEYVFDSLNYYSANMIIPSKGAILYYYYSLVGAWLPLKIIGAIERGVAYEWKAGNCFTMIQ